MDLIDKLQELSTKISKQSEHIVTEEATKNAFVMPFINALGYNVFDPTEVVPEFVADIGTKKGEKVDYAIMMDEKPIMLFECKAYGTDLSNIHASQLYRYFTASDARFGILTNGVEYRFYSDLDKPNRMDDKPFLIFDLRSVDERFVGELKKFTKSVFDVEHILSTANELKYRREIRNIIATEFNQPSEDFVKHFAKQVYSRPLFQSALDDFTKITKQALQLFVNEQIENRLKSALDTETARSLDKEIEAAEEDEELVGQPEEEKSGRQIITTDEEIEGYFAVKSILREVIDAKRIAMRDTQTYCGILLDNNNRKPICRLWFNRSQKYLGVFGEEKDEERIPITDVDDIYKYADQLKAVVTSYDTQG